MKAYFSTAAINVQTNFRYDVRKSLETMEQHCHELNEKNADETDNKETANWFQA